MLKPGKITLFLFLFIAGVFAGCKNSNPQPGKALRLSETQMTQLIRDVQIAESAIYHKQNLGTHPDTLKKNYYDQVFKHHGLSPEIFKENMAYYSQYPELLERIYDSVIAQMKAMQNTLQLEPGNVK